MMWRNFDFGQRLAIGAMMMFMGNAATMANFICSGILDKYPKLKIGMIESGAGWETRYSVVTWMERLP